EKDEFIYHEMITHVPMAVNPNIRKILKYIEYAREKGCSLTGSEDPDVQRLNVVNENTLDWM
ncbi:MAG: spermidine synthase, partial [Lachnospiraceae bacterium]